MKKYRLIGLLAIVITASTLFMGLGVKPAQAATIQLTEAQITSNTASQQNPDVYGDRIVWQDARNGNWDIYMYAPRVNMWQPEIQVTSSTGNEISPKIYQDTIVYQSDRNSNWDIYMYNITSKVETQITDNPAAQEAPAVYGNIIVWQDMRNGQWSWGDFSPYTIYIYNLTTQTEQLLPLYQSNYGPSISGNRIAYIKDLTWTGNSGTQWTEPCVYTYDFSTRQEVQIAKGDAYDMRTLTSTSVAGTWVAWASYYTPFLTDIRDWSVYVKDAVTFASWSSPGANQQRCDLSGDWPYMYVVYQDDRNGNWEIYMREFSSGVEDRVTNNSHTQSNPAIFVGQDFNGWYYNRIVYMDDRNGNWDIYVTDFGWVAAGGRIAPEPITPNLVIGHIQQIKSMIADTTQIPTDAFAGVNSQVKENRRNAMINQLNSAIEHVQAAADTQDLKVRRTDCQAAIDQLNDLINKTDGCTLRGSADTPGSRYTPDWITSYLDQMIRYSRNELQTLFNNIS